jgi:predicted metal-binding membrane protein
LARQRVVILAALDVTTVQAWIWVDRQATMAMPAEMAGPDLSVGMRAWPILVLWTVMMVGMMFPASAPMILTYSGIQAQRRRSAARPYEPVSVFTAAYKHIWVAFGALAFGFASGVDALAERSAWLTSNWHRLTGGLIATAGIYQFTPLKDRCLRTCRSPVGFLLEHWSEGWSGALRMGFAHGLYCAGCCWLLFVILVPIGVMNLVAMGIVTAVVFAEKTLPGGEWTARATGLGLLAYGGLLLLFPAAMPG